jgi:hypothetical protein
MSEVRMVLCGLFPLNSIAFTVICHGEQIMRSLWEFDISTVVLNDVQAEFGMAPAAEGVEGKM